MSLKCITVLALAIFFTAVSCPLFAGGGMYVDNLVVRNNNTQVFFDNFDDGNISDWETKKDCSLISQDSASKSSSLYLNWLGSSRASASHSAKIDQPGIVDLSAYVYLPPVEDQSHWTAKTIRFTNLILLSGNSRANIFVGVELRSGEPDYRLSMDGTGFSIGKNKTKETDSPVLSPGKWAVITLRLDKDKSTAYAYLDNKQLLSMDYEADKFASIKDVAVWGWLGDGATQSKDTAEAKPVSDSSADTDKSAAVDKSAVVDKSVIASKSTATSTSVPVRSKAAAGTTSQGRPASNPVVFIPPRRNMAAMSARPMTGGLGGPIVSNRRPSTYRPRVMRPRTIRPTVRRTYTSTVRRPNPSSGSIRVKKSTSGCGCGR